MKKLFIWFGVLVVVEVGFWVFQNNQSNLSSDYKRAEYIISGQKIKLGDGTFTYFGNEVKTDLDKDGRKDIVFLITQKIEKEVRYFIVGALDTPRGFIGLNGMMIGDNIAPQTTELSQEVGKEGQIVVNYAIRNSGEDLSVRVSQGKSMWIKYDSENMGFGEVVQNFEGESAFNFKNSSPDLIQVELPYPGAVVGKEFSVLGKARGTWFFEASFPVVLLDKDGRILAQGIAQANGDWMTTEFVPFKADLKVNDPNYIGKGTLILKKDNPSGDSVRDASASFEINIEY